MRVSTNMLTFNFMSSLNKSLERQNDLQEKLSDGKAIHRPSDDPVRTIRSLRFNINLRENEQYTQHVKDAQSWMETTDGAMSDLSSLMIKAKELVIKSVSTNPDVAMDAIAKELDGIINQVVQIGNTQIGDRYIFAGQNDKIQPFQRRTIDVGGKKIDAVVYNGDSNKISMRIQAGSILPSQDSVNLTGEEVFGPLKTVEENGNTLQTVDILNNLIRIKEAVEGGQPSPKSNPLSSDITKNATTGEHNPFTLRIDAVDANGIPSQVSYSIDGGVSWETSGNPGSKIAITAPPATTQTVTITDLKGLGAATVEYQLTTTLPPAVPATGNHIGDTYSLPMTTQARDTTWISKTGLYLVDSGHNHIIQADTELGARMSIYEQAQALLEKNNVTITGDVSANEDLDIAKALIDFKTSESIYRTALSIGAKLMPPTLADFLN